MTDNLSFLGIFALGVYVGVVVPPLVQRTRKVWADFKELTFGGQP